MNGTKLLLLGSLVRRGIVCSVGALLRTISSKKVSLRTVSQGQRERKECQRLMGPGWRETRPAPALSLSSPVIRLSSANTRSHHKSESPLYGRLCDRRGGPYHAGLPGAVELGPGLHQSPRQPRLQQVEEPGTEVRHSLPRQLGLAHCPVPLQIQLHSLAQRLTVQYQHPGFGGAERAHVPVWRPRPAHHCPAPRPGLHPRQAVQQAREVQHHIVISLAQPGHSGAVGGGPAQSGQDLR